MKQFVVLGLGNFGFNLATALTEEGNQVLAIDIDEKKIEEIKDRVTHAVVADATDKRILSELVSAHVDGVIVGLNGNMRSSMLAILYLKEMGIERIIVKAISDDHAKILKALGVTEIIFPERDVALRLAGILSTPNLIELIPLTPDYSIVEIAAPDDFVGKTLAELELRKRYGITVIAVKDASMKTFHLAPEASAEIRHNDTLVIIGKKADLDKLTF